LCASKGMRLQDAFLGCLHVHRCVDL
jgi:hypothetical protein